MTDGVGPTRMKHAVEHSYADGRFDILTNRGSCTQGGADTLLATHRRLEARPSR